jgi:type IV secretion system protein VirD4
MLDLSQYNAQTFMAAIDALLADKAAVMSAPADILLSKLNRKQVNAILDEKFKDKPSKAQYAADILPLLAPALVAEGLLNPEQWHWHLAMFTRGDGACDLVPVAGFAANPQMTTARSFLHEIFKHCIAGYDVFLAQAAATIATHQHRNIAGVPAIRAALSDGARWMSDSDLALSPYYTSKDSLGALLLGYTPDTDAPVYFAGHESLITVGGPGTGKSAGQVIPNLLRYPGSAVVLDVKGELWEKTAGYRKSRFGDVYRFAPTDPSGRTHRYNPFDFISSRPDEAATDCGVFSYQVVLENPKLHDPYWENKGRDFIWTFAMLVALQAPKQYRNLEALAEFVNLPLIDDPAQPIVKTIAALKQLAQHTRIPDLAAAANALKGGLGGPRLESVIDTSRRYLSPFARSGFSRTAMSHSDWSPQQLRDKPGTTVYICMPTGDLKTYAPLVRLVLYQHSRILQEHAAKPHEAPITFFLDEMPQLGNFESILEMQDLGRGAGLRLWMFAQHLGQLSKAFGKDRYAGIIEACRVRHFMQPDTEAAKLITPALGEVKDMFSGAKKPLAELHELMGRAFNDKTIITTRGDLPMALTKKMAYLATPNRILAPQH